MEALFYVKNNSESPSSYKVEIGSGQFQTGSTTCLSCIPFINPIYAYLFGSYRTWMDESFRFLICILVKVYQPSRTFSFMCLHLKVIRKFFLKHNKSFRWHLGDYEKHNFFPIWRSVRGETLIFVCFYGWVVCPAGVCGPAWRRPLRSFSLYKPVFNGNTTHP